MANLSNINNKFLVTTGGNVGIGVTGPTAKLHIGVSSANDDTFHIFNGSVRTHLLGSESSNGVIYLRSSANSNKVRINTSGDSYFNGGNVGIGTDSPSVKLEVDTNSTFAGAAQIGNSTGNRLYILNDDGGNRILLDAISSGGASNLIFANGGSESMRISSTGNVGIGTTTPDTKLEVVKDVDNSTNTGTDGNATQILHNGNASGTAVLKLRGTGSNSGAIVFGGGLGASTDKFNIISRYNNTKILTAVADGNVGIGKAPQSDARLHTYRNSTDAYNIFESSTNRWVFGEAGGVCQVGGRYGHHSGIQINTVGNVGIGVTPESWGTGGDTEAIQISTMTSLSEAFDGTQLASNFYFDGTNDKYIQSDFATSYLQIDGSHRWRYAASGTADANITWSEAMRIDSSGNTTFAGTINSDNITVGKSDGNNSSISLTANTGNWTFTNVQSSRNLEISDSDGTGTVMTINTSGNVGIGTTSPSELLTLNDASGAALQWQYNGGNYLRIEADSGGGSYYAAAGFYHRFFTSGAERMRIDSSGNVSIGTINRVSKLTIGAVESAANFNDGANNLRLETSSSSAASPNVAGAGVVFAQKWWSGSAELARVGAIYGVKDAGNGNFGGGLGFYTQPSGVSTDMVQRMRINSSGNVGIGTTSPDTPLDVQGAIQASESGGDFIRMQTDGTNNIFDVNSGAYVFRTSGFSERMRITSSGDVQLVGNKYLYANPSAGSTTIGAGFQLDAVNNIMKLWTNNTERMRINSQGNLLVGATALSDVGSLTKSHLLEGISESAGTGAVGVYNNSGTANCPSLVVLNRDTSTDSSNRFIQFYANVIGGTNTPMGGIVGNGASNVQFASLSDIREKENIKTIESSLNKISKLNPVEFDWKKSGEHINAGFIAQEVEEVFPEYVVENISNEGEEERKGLTGGMTSGIVAHLVKSIQELKADNDSLKARIETLENN